MRLIELPEWLRKEMEPCALGNYQKRLLQNGENTWARYGPRWDASRRHLIHRLNERFLSYDLCFDVELVEEGPPDLRRRKHRISVEINGLIALALIQKEQTDVNTRCVSVSSER